MTRTWWSEFRNGAPLASGLLSVAIGVLLGANIGTQSLLPGCADPLNVGLILAVTVSPIAIGAAAVHVSMLHKGGILHLAGTSTRGRGWALAKCWSAIAAWQAIAYAATQAFILFNADTTGYCSVTMLVLPLSGLAFVVLMSGIGIALGSLFPHWAVGVVGALSGLIVVLGIQQLEGGAGRFVPTSIYTFYQPFFEPNVALNLARAALYGTLATGLVILFLVPRRIRLVALASTGMAVGAIVVAALTIDPTPVQYRDPPEETCREEGSINFCVWPESVHALQPGLAALSNAVAVVGDRFPTPTQFSQEGLVPVTDPGVMRFDSRVISDADLQFAAVRALVAEPQCDAGLDAWFDLIDWVTAVRTPEFASEEVTEILRGSEVDQRAWLSSRYRVATTACG